MKSNVAAQFGFLLEWYSIPLVIRANQDGVRRVQVAQLSYSPSAQSNRIVKRLASLDIFRLQLVLANRPHGFARSEMGTGLRKIDIIVAFERAQDLQVCETGI